MCLSPWLRYSISSVKRRSWAVQTNLHLLSRIEPLLMSLRRESWHRSAPHLHPRDTAKRNEVVLRSECSIHLDHHVHQALLALSIPTALPPDLPSYSDSCCACDGCSLGQCILLHGVVSLLSSLRVLEQEHGASSQVLCIWLSICTGSQEYSTRIRWLQHDTRYCGLFNTTHRILSAQLEEKASTRNDGTIRCRLHVSIEVSNLLCENIANNVQALC